jgi:catechol 2,3-dioxygenase-like lactoylglutathione lyase family enzyme
VESPIKGVSHLQLRVSDMAKSEAWYTAALGLTKTNEGDGFVALSGGRYLVVLSPGYTGARDLDHIAFAVGDADALTAWSEHLAAAGIEHEGPTDTRQGVEVHLYDPDGLEIELISPAR